MSHSEIEATWEQAFVRIKERDVTGLIICMGPLCRKRRKKPIENGDVAYKMICVHALNREGKGVRSPMDAI